MKVVPRSRAPAAPTEPPPFSRLGAGLVTATIGGSLLLSFLLLVYRSDHLDTVSVAADSYSVSALGHHLFVELLRESGCPVSRSRFGTGRRAQHSLLLVAEPRGSDAGELRGMLADASSAVVVLPKRRGNRDPQVEHWIGDAALLGTGEVQAVLRTFASGATVERAPGPPSVWQFHGEVPELPFPVADDLQLLLGTGFRPLVRCRHGALAGRFDVGGTAVTVIADPDVLANHGIDDGRNAEFAIGLFDALRDGRPVVVDETLHGFELQPSLWEQLGRFPLVLVLVHCLLLLALIAWLARGRFGPTAPPPRELASDKQALLDNTAELLLRSDHTLHGLRRYFRDRVRAAAVDLRLPPGGDPELVAALAEAATKRQRGPGFPDLCRELEQLGREGRRVPPWRAVNLARRIHSTCEEIVHGRR